MHTSRRALLIGAGATLLAAPAIVRAASLMPVRNRLDLERPWSGWVPVGPLVMIVPPMVLTHIRQAGALVAEIAAHPLGQIIELPDLDYRHQVVIEQTPIPA